MPISKTKYRFVVLPGHQPETRACIAQSRLEAQWLYLGYQKVLQWDAHLLMLLYILKRMHPSRPPFTRLRKSLVKFVPHPKDTFTSLENS